MRIEHPYQKHRKRSHELMLFHAYQLSVNHYMHHKLLVCSAVTERKASHIFLICLRSTCSQHLVREVGMHSWAIPVCIS
jgi:hypothetical protein